MLCTTAASLQGFKKVGQSQLERSIGLSDGVVNIPLNKDQFHVQKLTLAIAQIASKVHTACQTSNCELTQLFKVYKLCEIELD